jgi:hypothetical protein
LAHKIVRHRRGEDSTARVVVDIDEARREPLSSDIDDTPAGRVSAIRAFWPPAALRPVLRVNRRDEQEQGAFNAINLRLF